MNLKHNDFKEKYFFLKDRQVREYNKAKRRVEKKKAKLVKEKERQERKLKRRQEKIDKMKEQQKAANPFSCNDEENEQIGQNVPEETFVSESDTESSHSDSSESEKSDEDSDQDGLHAPKSMHELRQQEAERHRIKNNKKRDKELKRIIKERNRKSKASNSGANGNGGFLRSSVLVQKTLNFFGRGSKPQELVKQTEDDEAQDQETRKLETNERKSDAQPQLNDFFVQTSSIKAQSDHDSGKENVFEQANKEVDIEYFQNKDDNKENKNSDKNSSKKSESDEGEAEEIKIEDNQIIFNYEEKAPTGLPPLSKGKKHFSRQSTSGVKKIMAPPKSNGLRHSVLQKVDLLDLLEN